jgi:very-short-patch-repair endonuclease
MAHNRERDSNDKSDLSGTGDLSRAERVHQFAKERARVKRRKRQTEAQILLAIHVRELGVTDLKAEFRIDPARQWRADLALPAYRILIECDGGMHTGGHKRGAALEDDYDKQNSAQMLGWRILRFSNRQVLCGEAKEFLWKFLNHKGDS